MLNLILLREFLWGLAHTVRIYSLFIQPVLVRACHHQVLLSLNIPKIQLEINQNANAILDIVRVLLLSLFQLHHFGDKNKRTTL